MKRWVLPTVGLAQSKLAAPAKRAKPGYKITVFKRYSFFGCGLRLTSKRVFIRPLLAESSRSRQNSRLLGRKSIGSRNMPEPTHCGHRTYSEFSCFQRSARSLRAFFNSLFSSNGKIIGWKSLKIHSE